MNLLQQFTEKLSEIKKNEKLSNFIKKDEKLYKRILEVNKKIKDIKFEDLTENQLKVLDDVVLKIDKSTSIHINSILLYSFKKMIFEIKEGNDSIENYDKESQDFIKKCL